MEQQANRCVTINLIFQYSKQEEEWKRDIELHQVNIQDKESRNRSRIVIKTESRTVFRRTRTGYQETHNI